MKTLCTTFRRQALYTWWLLRKARLASYQLGEETITDLNQVEMKRRHPIELTTIKFEQARASSSAWEWWLTGPSRLWLGFRVQTHIMDVQSFTYPQLHPQRAHPSAFQMESLIESALRRPVPCIPLHCLYSNWDAGQFSPPKHSCASHPRSIRNYGCAVMSAFVAQNLHFYGNKTDLKSLLPYLHPWHCLMCFQPAGEGLPSDLPHRAWTYWQNIMLLNEPVMLSDLDPTLRQIYTAIRPVKNPPDYVSQLLHDGTLSPPDDGLGRISVFRQLDPL